jgi:hypothetical protein
VVIPALCVKSVGAEGDETGWTHLSVSVFLILRKEGNIAERTRTTAWPPKYDCIPKYCHKMSTWRERDVW